MRETTLAVLSPRLLDQNVECVVEALGVFGNTTRCATTRSFIRELEGERGGIPGIVLFLEACANGKREKKKNGMDHLYPFTTF